jgi:hypothetical protein
MELLTLPITIRHDLTSHGMFQTDKAFVHYRFLSGDVAEVVVTVVVVIVGIWMEVNVELVDPQR